MIIVIIMCAYVPLGACSVISCKGSASGFGGPS